MRVAGAIFAMLVTPLVPVGVHGQSRRRCRMWTGASARLSAASTETGRPAWPFRSVCVQTGAQRSSSV